MATSPQAWRDRLPAAPLAVGALATLALVLADALVRDAAQPPRGDELIYERMADAPFDEHTFPFAYRIGLPLLVHVLPFGHETSFSGLGWLAAGASAADPPPASQAITLNDAWCPNGRTWTSSGTPSR